MSQKLLLENNPIRYTKGFIRKPRRHQTLLAMQYEFYNLLCIRLESELKKARNEHI